MKFITFFAVYFGLIELGTWRMVKLFGNYQAMDNVYSSGVRCTAQIIQVICFFILWFKFVA